MFLTHLIRKFKLLKLANKEFLDVVNKYLADPLCDNLDDDKCIKKVIKEAKVERDEKEVKRKT